MRLLDQRPAEVAQRQAPGNWEDDRVRWRECATGRPGAVVFWVIMFRSLPAEASSSRPCTRTRPAPCWNG
jgi:hypothetical protein